MTEPRQLDAIYIAISNTKFRLPCSKPLYHHACKMGGA